ncbi:MAG: DUF2339 domain-containing protein [Rudaea sp.]|nr:DUF2339 domain-containing protein [Rudaea sp.]
MTFLFMLIGALLAPYLCAAVFGEGTGWTSAVIGACLGGLFAQLRHTRRRLAELERSLVQLRGTLAAQKTAPGAAHAATPESAAALPAAKPAEAVPAPAPGAAARPVQSSVVPPVAGAAKTVSATAPPKPAVPASSAAMPPAPSRPDPLTQAATRLKRWFTEGNVPVKVGVIVLFLGVGSLLKYAADSGWLRVPVEFRLAGIAAAALAGLVFAWRKRTTHRAFALSLQGGATGVLILTIFAAFRLYHVLPAGFAFALLIVVVAGAGALAVLQDALALAVLAIVGGFLAPILVATDSGNHVALFSYYAVLNAAIFAIAWLRPWRALNLLGFVFTFGIGTAWGALRYRPELFSSTEPFLLLFFAFYLLIPLLYARRLAPDRRDLIDAALVFGLPLLAFPLQAALLHGERMPLAWSALGAAAIYTMLAALELRRLGYRLLGQSHALLALGFATLAVPLALSARATACTWAIEGAALLWLGLRQQRRLPRWIGYGLQACAGLAFVYGYGGATDAAAILNGEFFGAILIGLAGLLSARLLSRADERAPLTMLLFAWAWAWWLAAWGTEIERFAPAALQADWWLALIAVTGALGAEGFRRLAWRESAWPALALFVLALPLIALTAIDNHGVLEGWAGASWALWLIAALYALYGLASRQHRFVHIAHFIFLWTVAPVLGTELGHVADAHLELGDIWIALAALCPFAALFWLVLIRAALASWPDTIATDRLRHWLLVSIAAVLGIAWFIGLFIEGQPAPLPYLPLLNPLELAQFGFLLLVLAWYRRAAEEGHALLDAEFRARALAVAGVILLTAITLRSAHFLGGVAWSEALWTSALAQAALSISWTVAGIAAMLLGKYRGSRAVWIGGGALMGVVILKLLLIDRQHLQALPAIIGVLVVGVLLIGVGYFAPVPPRARGDSA